MMNLKIWMFSAFALLVLLAGVVYFASAQTSSEIVNTWFYDAQPSNGSSLCMLGLPTCVDTDNGYVPAVQATIGANVALMNPYVTGPNTNWGTFTMPQCVQSTELCNSAGNLLELVCGSSVGIPNAVAFNVAFPNNYWQNSGEPVALIEVNCASYATNHPWLGLTGTCDLGACI